MTAHVAKTLADVATIGILEERAIHDSNVVSAQLEHVLSSPVTLEQGCRVDEALNS